MSWRIDGAIAEAEAQIAMLEAAGLPEAARLCRARRDGLQTAKAFAELDWTDAVEEAEAEAAAESAKAAAMTAKPLTEEEEALAAATAGAAGAPPAKAPAPSSASAAAAPRANGGGHNDTLTPEREAMLRRDWGDLSITLAQLHTAYNALDPTRTLTKPLRLYEMAKRLGMPTRRSDQAEAEGRLPGAAQPATPAPSAAPPPAAARLDWRTDPLGTMTAEERRDAEEIILVQRRGAREMAADFDWPLDRCQAIATALRTAQREAAAA